jgi:hypothetical protein
MCINIGANSGSENNFQSIFNIKCNQCLVVYRVLIR